MRVRLVQDDGTVGGTLKIAVEARTEGLAANTFGSATIDIGFDPALLTPTGFEDGVLTYSNDPYTISPSVIGGGTVLRLTISSQGVGTDVFELDGYEVGNAFEALFTFVFTIDAAFDATQFPIDCSSLSVGYYDSVDNASDSGVILDNSTGIIPMASVLPLALRTLNLTANEGWRTLSGLAGMNVDDLFGQLSTRGFTGADDESGFPNVWRWDEATGWGAAASQSEVLPPTDGIAFFALSVDGGASVRVGGAFADYAYSTGSPASCSAFPLSFDVSYTSGGTTGFEAGWNLEGNPTAGTLDWDAPGWVTTGLTNTIYIYDTVSGQYLTWNGTTGSLGNGLIAPLQGFWVKATGSPAPALVAPAAALTSGGTFYGRSAALTVTDSRAVRAQNGTKVRVTSLADKGARVRPDTLLSGTSATIALRIEGEVQGTERWAAAYVSFQPGGEAGLDRYDAEALAGLGTSSLDVYTVLGDDTEDAGSALEIDARPVASLADGEDGPLEIPLAVEAFADGEAVGGKFTLSLQEATRLPVGVRPLLVDTETGATVDLLSGQGYAFEVAASELRGDSFAGEPGSAGARFARETATERMGTAHAGSKGEAVGKADSEADTRPVSAPTVRRGNADAARFLLRFESAAGVAGNAAGRGASGADTSDDTVASTRSAASLPEEYALESVYPNPFAGRATVRYALPESADVRLVAYDLLGRRVAVVQDAARPAGYHTATWDAAGLPSGVYVLRLELGAHTFTERVTVMR